MDFTGRVYFSFASLDVWQFFRLLLAAQREGARAGLEWKPFLVEGIPDGVLHGDTRLLAASEVVRHDIVLAHGAFVSAILTAIHGEGTAVDDPGLLRLAAHIAQIDADIVAPSVIDGQGRVLLEAAQAEAGRLGVDAVPTLYRHGPVLAIRTTAAATVGGGLARLQLIDRMLEDDGLWELRKP